MIGAICRAESGHARARRRGMRWRRRGGRSAIVVVLSLMLVTDAVAARANTGSRGPASLTAVPGVAVRGASFTLAGSGLPARGNGTVSLDSVRVARFKVDARGGWLVVVRVPSRLRSGGFLRVAAGAREITTRFPFARHRYPGWSMTSIAALSSGEQVRLANSGVRAGSSVLAKETGFPREAKIAVWLDRHRLRTLRANPAGAVSASVAIPEGTRASTYALSVRSGAHRLALGLVVTPGARRVAPPQRPSPPSQLPSLPSGAPGESESPPSSPLPPAGNPAPPSTPPTIAPIADQSGSQGVPVQPITPWTSGQVSGFSASGLPPGIAINFRTGLMSGTPSRYGTYASTVTATGPGGEASTTFSWEVDPVVDAVGDTACDPQDPDYNNGLGEPGVASPGDNCLQKSVSDLVVNPLPSALLELGDNQQQDLSGPGGALNAYQTAFGPTFGRANSVAYPTLGNAEYGHHFNSGQSLPPTAYDTYFANAGVFSQIGAMPGSDTTHITDGYYSFNVGSWHIIALNSNCQNNSQGASVGDCGAGGPEETWLEQNLDNDHQRCTLAFWHHPRWDSGTLGNDVTSAAWWTDLYNAHATLVVNAHGNNHYERFATQDPDGDPTPHGIREFISSAGGLSHGTPPQTPGDQRTLQVANYDTYGVLRLTLHPGSYDWQFVPATNDGQGTSFTDSGSAPCAQ